MRTLIAVVLSLAAGAALAQQPGFTPAPVPNRDGGAVTPADRAGRPDGSDMAAPFSGLPTSIGNDRGQATPSTVGTPEKQGPGTPSLSR